VAPSASERVDNAVGVAAVALARRTLEETLGGGRTDRPPVVLPDAFRALGGVFVTLRHQPGDRLRGCIGYPLPVLPLGTAVRRAAIAAATEDPRFRAVTAEELPHLTIEVSLLTPPEPLRRTPETPLSATVVAGRDGLVVEGFGTSGLLLPQVATEMGWNAEELLDGTCEKAGLPAGAWRDPRVTVRRFRAAVFVEERPGGPVRRTAEPVTPGDAPPAPRT
jgi:uncharacterized protein